MRSKLRYITVSVHPFTCISLPYAYTVLPVQSIRGECERVSICRYIQQNLNNPFGLHPQAASLACGELSSFISVTMIYHEFLSDSTVLFDYNFSYQITQNISGALVSNNTDVLFVYLTMRVSGRCPSCCNTLKKEKIFTQKEILILRKRNIEKFYKVRYLPLL